MADKDVYAKIYDIVAENMSKADVKFEYQKETFLCDVGTHPRDIVVPKIIRLENREFFQALFVITFKRLPEREEVKKWIKQYDLPKEVFQRRVLHMVEKNSVVAINQMKIIDNPYFEQKTGIKYHLLGHLYGLTDKSSLREFGKKLPESIQRVIRKVFL